MCILPPWVPWPRGAVLVSGVFELLGDVGLLWQPTRQDFTNQGLIGVCPLITHAR